MGWNNGLERKRFEARQKKQAEEYRKLGMTEEQIQTMYEFDLEQHMTARTERMHEVPLLESEFDPDGNDESDNALLKDYLDELSVDIDEYGTDDDSWWIQEIHNKKWTSIIRSLSEKDREILVLICIDGWTQEAVAEHYHMSQSTISRHLNKVLSLLKKCV